MDGRLPGLSNLYHSTPQPQSSIRVSYASFRRESSSASRHFVRFRADIPFVFVSVFYHNLHRIVSDHDGRPDSSPVNLHIPFWPASNLFARLTSECSSYARTR
jgi:hypothetical protein